MNYWPAFFADLAETFEAYADYFYAYKAARKNAEESIKKNYPGNYEEGQCGWCIGAAAFSFYVTGWRSGRR